MTDGFEMMALDVLGARAFNESFGFIEDGEYDQERSSFDQPSAATYLGTHALLTLGGETALSAAHLFASNRP